MLIHIHVNMKRALDVANRGGHIQQHPIRMGGADGETIGPGEGDQGLIIRFGRAEPLGKKLGGKVLVENRAGRLIKFFEEIG